MAGGSPDEHLRVQANSFGSAFFFTQHLTTRGFKGEGIKVKIEIKNMLGPSEEKPE